MSDRLKFDDILLLAERESGALGLADAELLGLARGLVEKFDARGPYPPQQVDAMRRQIQRMLAGRLKLVLDRQRYPGIAEEKIERPVFIVGFARSGTTLLHSLLAEDPEVLKIQSWNLLSPSPPPGAGPVAAERIAYAQRCMEQWMDFCPAQKPLHPYIDKGAHQLCENEEAFSLGMHNAYCYYYFNVPTLESADTMSFEAPAAYRFLRELLQHLQWNTGKTRWVLKEVGAQLNLAALFAAYPDAICVWPHRPLVDNYASSVALRSAIYDTISGRPNNWSNQPKQIVQNMKAAFDTLLTSDLIRDPRILHLPFGELAADPIGTVGRIYARLGLDVSEAFDARLRAWLANPENAVDRYGRYPYSYEAFGLDRAWVEELFADYSRYFGLD